jgi:hypothetical protein
MLPILPELERYQGEEHEHAAQDFLFHRNRTSVYDSIIRTAGQD